VLDVFWIGRRVLGGLVTVFNCLERKRNMFRNIGCVRILTVDGGGAVFLQTMDVLGTSLLPFVS
jgi:hypothetical protein